MAAKGPAVGDVASHRRVPADVLPAAKYRVAPTKRTVVTALLFAVALVLLWRFDPADANLPLCSFHTLTGLDCPGCGATRATHELLHGHLAAALRYNALWVVSLPLAIYLAASELRVLSGRRPLPGDLPRRVGFWLCAVAAAIAFFVARNVW